MENLDRYGYALQESLSVKFFRFLRYPQNGHNDNYIIQMGTNVVLKQALRTHQAKRQLLLKHFIKWNYPREKIAEQLIFLKLLCIFICGLEMFVLVRKIQKF